VAGGMLNPRRGESAQTCPAAAQKHFPNSAGPFQFLFPMCAVRREGAEQTASILGQLLEPVPGHITGRAGCASRCHGNPGDNTAVFGHGASQVLRVDGPKGRPADPAYRCTASSGRDCLANTIHACGDHSGVNLNAWMITSTSWPFFGANPLNSHRLMCIGIGCCEMRRGASSGL